MKAQQNQQAQRRQINQNRTKQQYCRRISLSAVQAHLESLAKVKTASTVKSEESEMR